MPKSNPQNQLAQLFSYIRLLFVMSLIFGAGLQRVVRANNITMDDSLLEFGNENNGTFQDAVVCSDQQLFLQFILQCDFEAFSDDLQIVEITNDIDFESELCNEIVSTKTASMSMTPLYAALNCEDDNTAEKMANMLLDMGASPARGRKDYSPDDTITPFPVGQTAFYQACNRGYLSLVKRMGASINTATADQRSNLIREPVGLSYDAQLLKAFNEINNDTPLGMLVSSFVRPYNSNDYKIIDYLISKKNADVNQTSIFNGVKTSLLFRAIFNLTLKEDDFSVHMKQKFNVVHLLLSHDAKFISNTEKAGAIATLLAANENTDTQDNNVSSKAKSIRTKKFEALANTLMQVEIVGESAKIEVKRARIEF